MNYYNPYFYTMPANVVNTARPGLFSRLFDGLTFSRFMDNTQRALNFANQAIPFVKQVKPMIGNAKTMFKVMNEFKKSEKPRESNNHNQNSAVKNTNRNSNNSNNNNIKNSYTLNNGPTFFM